MVDLIDLTKNSIFEKDVLKTLYPTKHIDFESEIQSLLRSKGFIEEEVPLNQLHLHLQPEEIHYRYGTENKVQVSFYDTSEKFNELYLDLIKYLSQNVFDFDFIFQTTPNFRFHFPGQLSDDYRSKEGTYLGLHSDTLNGWPFEVINAWLPFTKYHESSALHIAPLEESVKILSELCEDINYNAGVYHKSGWDLLFMKANSNVQYQRSIINSCKPLEMLPEEVVFFDPRCIHGPVENQGNETRISMDFRLIPVKAYEKMTREYVSSGGTRRKFIKGDVFFEKSAMELFK